MTPLSKISWAGPTSVAAGSHESKMPSTEAGLTSWEIKVKVCVEYTGCMCLCELGGSKSDSRAWCVSIPFGGLLVFSLRGRVGGDSPPFPPSVVPFKQLEACQSLQGCEDTCSLCNEKGDADLIDYFFIKRMIKTDTSEIKLLKNGRPYTYFISFFFIFRRAASADECHSWHFFPNNVHQLNYTF